MDNSYTKDECVAAVEVATTIINARTKGLEVYTRGTNDCAALLVEYDKALRGPTSKAQLGFEWNSPRDFVVKLRRCGFTVESYLEHCGYEIIKNKRPKLGDVAFSGGAMIAGPRGWISTAETNEGVVVARQMMYLEINMSVIARPTKD